MTTVEMTVARVKGLHVWAVSWLWSRGHYRWARRLALGRDIP